MPTDRKWLCAFAHYAEVHRFDDVEGGSRQIRGKQKRRSLLGHQQATDAYLLALAIEHNGRLVTFDRKIRIDLVLGGEPRHLVTL